MNHRKVKAITIKLLEENIDDYLYKDKAGHKKFYSLKNKHLKTCLLSKLKTAFQKTTSRKWKGKSQIGRRYSQYIRLTKDLFPEYINSYNSIRKRQIGQEKNGQKTPTDTS